MIAKTFGPLSHLQTGASNDRAKAVAFPLAPYRMMVPSEPAARAPPFFRQFFPLSFFAGRFSLGFSSRFCNGSLLLRRSCLANLLQRSRRRQMAPAK